MSPISKIISFFCLLIFLSCENKPGLTAVEINKQYAIGVPENAKRTTDINSKASLQFEDLVNNFYMIVIDESKHKLKEDGYEYTLTEYYDYSKQLLIDPNAQIQITDPDSITIKKFNGLTANLKGKINDYDVYYKLAVVESPTHFYQVFMWTFLANREQYERMMNDIIYSFEEI
jgi:hypothetical protein